MPLKPTAQLRSRQVNVAITEDFQAELARVSEAESNEAGRVAWELLQCAMKLYRRAGSLAELKRQVDLQLAREAEVQRGRRK